ncbi:MAG: hypothetical protein ABI811_22435 [Acidobacteriota bacterium]
MATLTNVFGKFFPRTVATAEATSPAFARRDQRYEQVDTSTRVRVFANEDIYFYVKHIDNTAVLRQADPASDRASWKMIGMAAAAAVVLICILMPKGMGVLAGYEIQSLRHENQKLVSEQNTLELQEAQLMSPERMAQLAKMQQFIDPAPDRVVYLDAPGDTEFAAISPAAGTGK